MGVNVNDDLPDEIDFFGGTRGKFYRPDAKLNLPVYLDDEVLAYLSAIGSREGLQLSAVANDLLRKTIAILESVK